MLIKYGWYGSYAFADMLMDDSEDRLARSYTADCIGAITKAIHKNKDLPLFSELIQKTRKTTNETAETVIIGILEKLGAAPEKGEPGESV